jgi:hypothetical protein
MARWRVVEVLLSLGIFLDVRKAYGRKDGRLRHGHHKEENERVD